jgi:predicted nucleic acid-binding protein
MLKEYQNINTIITDASCFILFDKIGCIHILEDLYGQVITTPEIAAEYGKRLPGWVQLQSVKNRNLLNTYAEMVDIGEASAIALAFEVVSPSLILDDLKGRNLADRLQLTYTGSIGVLILARQQGVISLLQPYFEKIKTTDFRIPASLLQALLNIYDN